MSDNLDHPPANPKPPVAGKNDPFYADELDVLEALLKLEKKYGKQILTDEQKEKLRTRHKISFKKQLTEEEVRSYATILVEGLVDGVEVDVEKVTGKKNPPIVDVFQRNLRKEELFKSVYGYYPNFLVAKLVKELKGRTYAR